MGEASMRIATTVDVRCEGDVVRIAGRDGQAVDLAGAVYREVVQRLQAAPATPTVLVAELRPEFEPLRLLAALAELREVGAVIDRSPGDGKADVRRPGACLVVHGNDAPVVAEALRGALVLAGADLAGGGGTAPRSDALDVVVLPTWRAPTPTVSPGRPWLAVHSAGTALRVGPLVVPGGPGCWACLRHRLASTQPVSEDVDAPTDPLALVWAAALIAEIGRDHRQGGRGPGRPGVMWGFDHAVPGWSPHVLLPWPDCPACGATSVPEPTGHPRIAMAGTGDAVADRDFGTRGVGPDVTARRLERFVSPLLGPITQLRRIDVEPPLHAWSADGNPAVGPSGAVQRTLRKRAGGKGTTDVAARASALAESVERLQGRWWRDRPGRTVRFIDADDSFVHPNAVQLYSDHQLEHRRTGAGKDHIPEPFDPGEPVAWTPFWSLTASATRWLPTSICWFGYTGRSTSWVADSNGCGAGNTMTEAVLGGLLELVERDAVGIWWLNRLRRPAFDLPSAGDPWLDAAVDRFAALGRSVHVLDVTSDLEVPVAAAVSVGADGGTPVMGFGAHLDARVAIRRAVGEIVQMLGAATAGTGGRRSTSAEGLDPVTARWMEEADLDSQPYLVPAGEPVAVRRPAVGGPATASSEVAHVRSRIEGAGHEILVLDQTRAEIGFPTVRVVAPGLRHFWHRLAPGRLYDVPVEQGWLERPIDEVDVNPFTMPM